MNAADVSILSIILVSSLISFFQGFVKEILSLLAWSLSLSIAIGFIEELANLLALFIPFADLRLGIALVTLFFVTFIIFLWVNYLIINSLGQMQLSMTERFIGMLLGLIRGNVIIVFCVLLIGLTQLPATHLWRESFFIQKFKIITSIVCERLSADAAAQFSF